MRAERMRWCTPLGAATLALLAGGLGPSASGDLKHPDWHPGGRRLVAEGSCAGSIDLYVIDLDAHTVRRVWDGGFTEGYPRWFPDGVRVAFHQIDDDRTATLHVARVAVSGEGSEVVRLSDGPFDIEPAPSPDGRRLVYSRRGDQGQDIALFDVERARVDRVWRTPDAENFPSWSPDGGSVVYHARTAAGTQVYRRDLASGGVEALTDGDGPNLVGAVSPDGRRLVYTSERGGDRELYVRVLASGDERRLTSRAGRDEYAKFSPDGTRLAYHAEIGGGVVIRVLDLGSGDTSEFSCEDRSATGAG
jgi:TolB protein